MDPSRRGVVNGAGAAAANGSSSGSGSGSGSSSKQGNSSNNTTKDSNSTAPKKSSRMKEVVNYDDKRHLLDLEEDITHPVAHRQLNELEEHVNDLHESCWETESIFEEILEDITEDKFFTDGKVFDTSHHIHHAPQSQMLRDSRDFVSFGEQAFHGLCWLQTGAI